MESLFLFCLFYIVHLLSGQHIVVVRTLDRLLGWKRSLIGSSMKVEDNFGSTPSLIDGPSEKALVQDFRCFGPISRFFVPNKTSKKPKIVFFLNK
jgi:hypothetical protein